MYRFHCKLLIVLILIIVSMNFVIANESFVVPQNEPAKKAPVIIVGAGLTGLTLAYQLEKAGIDYILLEKNYRIGGRVQTVYLSQDIYFEGHMEEYWERNPGYKIIQELGLATNQDTAHAAVRIKGKNYPYQGETRDEYLAGIFTLDEQKAYLKWSHDTWAIYERLHQTFFQGKELPEDLKALTKISYAEFIQKQNLPAKVSEWIRITLEPEVATEWDEISALDAIDEMRIFLDSPDGFGELAAHVQGGNSKLIKALADKLQPEKIITNAQVTTVYHDSKGVFVRYLHEEMMYKGVYGHVVVVTVPLFAISNIQFYPALSEDKKKAIETMRFGGYIKIHMGISAEAAPLWEKYEENGDLGALLSDSPAGCIYNNSFSELENPQIDRILTLLVHGHFVTEMAGMSMDEMRNYAIENLDKVYPGVGQHVTFTEIFSYPKAIAYTPIKLNRSRFDELAEKLRAPQGNLYIGGDTTENTHSEGAFQAALRIAKALIAEKERLLGEITVQE